MAVLARDQRQLGVHRRGRRRHVCCGLCRVGFGALLEPEEESAGSSGKAGEDDGIEGSCRQAFFPLHRFPFSQASSGGLGTVSTTAGTDARLSLWQSGRGIASCVASPASVLASPRLGASGSLVARFPDDGRAQAPAFAIAGLVVVVRVAVAVAASFNQNCSVVLALKVRSSSIILATA